MERRSGFALMPGSFAVPGGLVSQDSVDAWDHECRGIAAWVRGPIMRILSHPYALLEHSR